MLQNALVTIREMSQIAAACYGAAVALGVVLLFLSGSAALVVIALVGLFISIGYTMPPIKLVYRGLGEIATAIGFGPVMLLGTYAVQSHGSLSAEALVASLPVASFVAMILYVNDIVPGPTSRLTRIFDQRCFSPASSHFWKASKNSAPTRTPTSRRTLRVARRSSCARPTRRRCR